MDPDPGSNLVFELKMTIKWQRILSDRQKSSLFYSRMKRLKTRFEPKFRLHFKKRLLRDPDPGAETEFYNKKVESGSIKNYFDLQYV